ncbi:MAG: ABC transporter permease [Chitinophagaceae bacterium]
MRKNHQSDPPQWIHFILRKRINARMLEEVEGDLHELYTHWVQRSGVFVARVRYIIAVLFYLRRLPGTLQKDRRPAFNSNNSNPLIHTDMFYSSLKIAWRQLLKNKGYALINIGGLAVGMGVVLMIGLWVWDEMSFDRYHKNYKRMAQAWQMVNFDGNNSFYNSMPVPLSRELRSKYPEVEAASMATYTKDVIVAYGDKKLIQPGIFAEEDLPRMLTLDITSGELNGLRDMHAVLLSQSLSGSIFGDQSPIGQVVRLNNKADVKVAGVYKDLPANSSFNGVHFIGTWQLYSTLDSYAGNALDKWDENSFPLYVLLREGTDVEQLSRKVRDIRMKLDNPPRYKPAFFLHPMSKWHLYSDFTGWAESEGLIKLVRLFAIAGIFVLLLACINFMNLSTARSEKRSREVGIRKTLGSLRRQLVYMFFSESVLIAFIALIACLLLAQLAMPFFNSIAGKSMHLPWTYWPFWAIMLVFTLVTGLLAGSYPALFLSSFRPVKVLKGIHKTGKGNVFSRKVLVVFQFAVSVILIIGTIIVGRQIQFAKDRSSGYNRDLLVEVYPHASLFKHYEALHDDLLKTGVVYDMAELGGSITADNGGTTDISWPGKVPGATPLIMANQVTHEFGHTIGWKMIKGRDFSRAFSTDTAGIIFNEEAVRLMGMKEPVDQIVKLNGRDLRIIGVVGNIVKGDPFRPVQPTLYTLSYKAANTVLVRINNGAGISSALSRVEKVFSRYTPAAPFDYKFVDDNYAAKFTTEVRIGKLSGFFAAFAIFISLLGLFGLASFMAERRTKEIGIRKVLGANVLQVWMLLSREFIILTGLAFIIASPIAYYFMYQWLENYTYRTPISLWIFAVVALSMILITIFTVSVQAIRAALMNPVKSIRME